MPSINSPTPDATTVAKGKIQLAGDLAGTAAVPRLSTSAINLGYTAITTDFTTASGTAVQITGLSSTVTVPTGGRRVKITVSIPRITTTGVTTAGVSIWVGTVGSGTLLTDFNPTSASGVAFTGATVVASHVPSAGSVTYNVGLLSTASNSMTINAATAGKSASIMVELI